MESKGRGRAFLFKPVPSTTDKDESTAVSVERTKSIATNISSDSNVDNSSEAKPLGRGRAALFREVLPKSTVKSTESSGIGSVGSASSVSSNPTVPRGRSRLFEVFNKSKNSSGIGTATSSILSSEMKNLALHSTTGDPSKISDKGISSVTTRPDPIRKHGECGRKLPARTNYVRLEIINSSKGIFEYEVIFNPSQDDDRIKWYLVKQMFHKFNGPAKIFDGQRRLWTPKELSKEMLNGEEFLLKNGIPVFVSVVYKRLKHMKDCADILNQIFKNVKNKLNLIQFDRKYFNPHMKSIIDDYKIEIWPGCTSSIQEHEDGVFMNIDACHRVLRTDSVLDCMQIIVNNSKGDDYKQSLLNEFVGTSVVTRYNKKIIKICDIDFEKNPRSTFVKNKQEISYIEYYQNQYNIRIKDHRQPLLVHKEKRKLSDREESLIYFIPELCDPCGLTVDMKNNFRLMKNMAEFTQVNPSKRNDSIKEFIRGIYENPDAKKILDDWELKIEHDTLKIDGRVLEPETIYFGYDKNRQSRRTVKDEKADWGRAASENPMFQSIELTNWALICTQRDNRTAECFFKTLREVTKKINLRVEPPKVMTLAQDSASLFCNKIREMVKDNIQIVVLIFPSQRDDRYAAIKKLCVNELGLPSQVINSKTLGNEKNIRSVVTKIILQINCKLGGTIWGVNIPFKQDGIMVCGIDAYHEATHKSNSVLALVCSLDKQVTRWTSETTLQNRGQELCDELVLLLKNCLQRWHDFNNNTLPTRIVVYRDGVGDGQLNTIRNYETDQFHRMFQQVFQKYEPILSYVIVQKRINSRFYVDDRGLKNNFVNPPPGSVFDNTITRRDWYDYFLVSQNVRHGTVTPTHYIVISDNGDTQPDDIQRLTYKMTHLYYNWNGTVRVPAPCQYAHKLAYLIGQHVKKESHQNLANTLYFL